LQIKPVNEAFWKYKVPNRLGWLTSKDYWTFHRFSYPIPFTSTKDAEAKVESIKDFCHKSSWSNKKADFDFTGSLENIIIENPVLYSIYYHINYTPKTELGFVLKEYANYFLPIASQQLYELLQTHALIDKQLKGVFKIGFYKGNYKVLTLVPFQDIS
jgi:hypothetical protein